MQKLKTRSVNEEFRHGSARWATPREVTRAGLAPGRPRANNNALQIGYLGRRALYLDGDAPLITIGGAGSGKLRDLLGYTVCNSPGQRMLILDPRGELGAISHHIHAGFGDFAYFWNPLELLGLPRHCCNPLDILDPCSLHFHADCKFIAEGLIPLSGSANGQYFEVRAREWLEALIKARIEKIGGVTLPDLYRTLNIIDARPHEWAEELKLMLNSRFEGVRRVAGEMLVKQQDSPKEFGGVMGELYAHLSFLDDPALLDALSFSEVSLEALCHETQPAKLFLNIPAEYLTLWSPVIRLFFTVTMLYKGRRPDAPRVTLLADEAGQLGKFEALLRAFTYGRGAGVRAWAVFQDAGQIKRNFGAEALQSFLGSAQMRQFFGVRDYDTAQLVSNMLGQETLRYDDELQQGQALHQKQETVRSVLAGTDPFTAAHQLAHQKRAHKHRAVKARALMSPDEILAMPEDQQILFISGKSLPPIKAHKYPYFTRPEMAGRYLANPYHPPAGRVQIVKHGGPRWAAVVTEDLPEHLKRFPQHIGERWSYVKGFKPGKRRRWTWPRIKRRAENGKR